MPPKKRVHVEPRSNGCWQLSELNPNPGGETLTSPYGAGYDEVGPFMVFNRSHIFVPTGGRMVLPVIPLGAVKEALLHVESGGEVGQVGAARPEDFTADVGRPDDTVDLKVLRDRYQRLATTMPLAELPSWSEWLEAEGYTPFGTPNASGTVATSTTGIDNNAKPLNQLV